MVTTPLAPKTSQWNEEKQAIPPLFNGDHLTRAEFERRYAAQPHLWNSQADTESTLKRTVSRCPYSLLLDFN